MSIPTNDNNGRGFGMKPSGETALARRVMSDGLLSALFARADVDAGSVSAEDALVVDVLRVIRGGASLTRPDLALFGFMVARSRLAGLRGGTHCVHVDELAELLQGATWDEVREMTQRLSTVLIQVERRSDEWRCAGHVTPVNAFVRESLTDVGERHVCFDFPLAIRELLASRPRFDGRAITDTSKYTAAVRRLLDAVGDGALEIEPEALASEVGFPVRGGVLNYGAFNRRCLEPVLEDFVRSPGGPDVRLELVRDTGRGRRVLRLVWHVSASDGASSAIKLAA